MSWPQNVPVSYHTHRGISAEIANLLRTAGLWATYAAFGILVIKLIEAAGANSLWIDEFCTLSDAYRPDGLLSWLIQLSGPSDPHFPTYFVLTRIISALTQFPEQSIEYFVRLPGIWLSIVALGGAIFWSLADRRRISGPLLALLAIAVLLADANWRWWAPEARMYGPIGTLTVAMVIALARFRIIAACVLGLFISLLYPLGAVAGFVPILVVGFIIPVFNRAGLLTTVGEHVARWARIAACFVGIILIFWDTQKFILTHSQGVGLWGGGDDIWRILDKLSVPGMVLSVIAIGFAFLTANRKKRAGALDPEDYQQTLFVLIGNTVFLLIILLACAALILAKPAIVQQGGQYISWINPAIYAIAVVGLSMIIDVWWLSRMGRANESSCSRLELGVIVATLCVAAWVFMALRDTTFGYGGNTGLRAAATYLDAVADKRSAITFDTFEMFDYPYRFRVGFNCARGGQIVPYLNPAIRSRIPCQASDGQVGFGLSVDRVYVVREPLAWKGNRQIVLSGFPLRSKLLFNRTIVEEYVRESSP